MRQKVRKGIILVSFLLLPAIFYYFSPYLIIISISERILSGSCVDGCRQGAIRYSFSKGV